VTVKIGSLAFATSLFARQVVGTFEYEILSDVRFAGFNKRPVGDNLPTVGTGKQTVIGKVVLDGDPLGHPQVVTSALLAMRDRLNRADLNSVIHF
jgi:hypothetical protein